MPLPPARTGAARRLAAPAGGLRMPTARGRHRVARHTAGSTDRGHGRHRHRRRRHRRQRRRLFSEHGCRASGRRIVLIERDTGYRDGSTGRSAGGVRQQFSTPENIAMSQFTLAVFRSLKAMFGADADVGFREQGYLLLATPEAQAILAENVALQQSMGADIELLDGAGLARTLPLAGGRRASPPAASAGRARAGSTRPASPPCSARRPRQRGVTIALRRGDRHRSRRSRVEAVALASGGRIACGSARQCRRALGRAGWRRWPGCGCPSSRASATSTSSTAARRPRRCTARR